MGWPQEGRGLDGCARRILARKAGPWADRPSLAAHFARLALGQGRQAGASMPRVVETTLDAGLQRFAIKSVSRNLQALGMDNVRDAAVLVLDNRKGQVLAYVGSSGHLSRSEEHTSELQSLIRISYAVL